MGSRLVHRKNPGGFGRISAKLIAEIPVQRFNEKRVPKFELKLPASMISHASGSFGSKILRLSRIFRQAAEDNSTISILEAARQSGLTTDAVKKFASQFKQQTGIQVLKTLVKKQKN